MTSHRFLAYEVRHVVTLQETNLLGNVYFVNHLAWQGECREMFLREHAPHVVAQLSEGLVLATVRCSCEYFADVMAFDELLIRMRLVDLTATRLWLSFEYTRIVPNGEETVARGGQQIACLRRDGDVCRPCPFPGELVDALRPYGAHAMQGGG